MKEAIGLSLFFWLSIGLLVFKFGPLYGLMIWAFSMFAIFLCAWRE